MICFIICFHKLFSLFVVRFTRESFLFSSVCAYMIFFFFIVYFRGTCPVSVSRMLAGVPCGSARIVFIALLWTVWSWFSSFFAKVPAFGSVCHYWYYCGIKQLPDGLLFRPLNSLLPVSVMMFCVAAWILVSIASMWVSVLFFLLISSPRYLYVSTSSRV